MFLQLMGSFRIQRIDAVEQALDRPECRVSGLLMPSSLLRLSIRALLAAQAELPDTALEVKTSTPTSAVLVFMFVA